MKLATIGTSKITESFIDGAIKSGQYILHTVYSRDAERAAAFAKKHKAQHFCDRLEAVAESEATLVYIASPNSLHFDQALYFLQQGKHVIVEKPIATQKGQLAALYRAAEENDVFLFEAFRHIHSPGFGCIQKHLQEIAPIRSISFVFNQYSSRYDSFKNGTLHNAFDPRFDGGAKLDLGIYPVSLAVALWGRPNRVQFASLPLHNGVDGAGSYIFSYDGFLCNIAYSKIADDLVQSEIVGEGGGLVIDKVSRITHIELTLRGGQGQDVTPVIYENDMQHEAEFFADVIGRRDRAAYRRFKEISTITNEILLMG